MATDVDQSCYGWSREELDDQDDSRDISVSQMLDHGSISFGRFALEPLSWEKRSVFTHNRYQEELEKFKAPGLVAQKKAYFEEYYKRIRAMKALQDNKPTESASNCGVRSGISEQIREDQRVIPSKSDVDEMISTIGSGVEKASADLTLDVDCESDLVKLDSHATFVIDNKNGENPPNSKHSQNLDRNSFHDEPITSIMHIEQEFIRVDNKLEPRRIISKSISRPMGVQNQRIIGKKSNGDELEYIVVSDVENASIEVPIGIDVTALLGSNPPVEHSDEKKMGKNSQNSKQFQLLDQNSCEDCKQHDFICKDNEAFSKKTEKYVSNDSCYSLSSPKVLEDKLVPEQKKVKEAVQGVKGSAFSSEVMEHSSTAGDLVKSEIKTTSVTVMLTQVLRDSSQKKNGKNNIPIVPNKNAVDRILSSKHATIASHASNKEMHSKATIPRPFAFATRKQAVASVSASARCDNKKILSSSSLPPKNVNSKGVSSNPGMQYIQKREKLEKRRGLEPRRQPIVTSRQVTYIKGASLSNVIRPLKARGQEPRRQPIVTSRQVTYIKGASLSNVIRPLKARGQEPRRQPIVTSRQATYIKGASASNVIRPLKARSVNLPTSCKGDSNAGSNSNRITRNNEGGKRRLIEVANDETCLKEVRSHGKSTIFHVLSRNQNPDIRKMAPSRIRDLSVNAKNSQLRDNAMGRGNSRPEKPRWR